jgi:hypothetical protein
MKLTVRGRLCCWRVQVTRPTPCDAYHCPLAALCECEEGKVDVVGIQLENEMPSL